VRPPPRLRLLPASSSCDPSETTPVVTAAAARAALSAMSAVAATISPLARMAPPITSVPRAIASVTGLVTAAPTFAFSVWRVLCAPVRLDARFAVLCLRDALAFFEAVFVGHDAMFAARPRALPPRADLDALAGDLSAVVFAGVLLREAAVLDTVFLEAAGFSFLDACVFFAASRPRALTPRPDLEAVVSRDLAIHNSL
jgi:hypothetical protein